MTPSAPSRRIALAVLQGFFVAVLVLGVPASLEAQAVTDPRIAEFDPSADHDAMLGDGQPAVSRYELQLFTLGAQEPFHSVDMGKPDPDPDGKIRFDFTGQVSAWPLPGGDYEARVRVVGPEGSSVSAPSNPFNFAGEQLQITAVTASQASVQPGTAVTWTASTVGGREPIQFQFYRSKDGGSWIEARAWSTSPTLTWTPGSTDIGTQSVQVWARNAESTGTYDAWFNGDDVVVTAPVVITAVSVDRSSPVTVGATVTWTAQTTGGIGPLQFQFYRSLNGGPWILARAWSLSNALTWTPTSSDTGTHVVQVQVREAGSTATFDASLSSAPLKVSKTSLKTPRKR